MTAAEIRARLDDSRDRLAGRYSRSGLGLDARLDRAEEELAFLAVLRKDHPAVAMKVDALIGGWVEYRDWLQKHYE